MCATDASAGALRVAADNGRRLGLAVEWRGGSWWSAIEPTRAFDLVVSNPPYIPRGDPHLHALRDEPELALSPGETGLEALSVIVAGAAPHLGPDGWLLLEHGHDQAAAVAALLRGHGFVSIETRTDIAGLPRCTGGRL